MSYDLRTAFVVFLLLNSGASAAFEDNPPQSESGVRLGRILDDWQRQSAERKSLDVRFTGHDHSPVWWDEPFSGHVVLDQGGRALVEVVRHGREGKSTETERLIWTDDLFHMLRLERKEHVIWTRAVEDRGRLPATLALPFLWNVSVERLKSRYNIALVKEDAGSRVLSFKPITEAGRTHFSKAYLQIDGKTYLPRRYFIVSPDGKSTKDYRITESRLDQAVPKEVFEIPAGKGWDVMRSKAEPGDESKIRKGLLDLWFKADSLP